jgi:hypothetical protein
VDNFHDTDSDIAVFEVSTLDEQEIIDDIGSLLEDKEREPPE